MSVTCPVCGATSDTIYRCDRCGKDLVDESEDHDGPLTDGGQPVDPDAIERPESVDELAARAAHPEELDQDLAYLLAQTDFEEYPHRHPDRLAAAWADADSIRELANDLDSAPRVISRWLHIWGLSERSERRSLAQQLRAAGGEV